MWANSRNPGCLVDLDSLWVHRIPLVQQKEEHPDGNRYPDRHRPEHDHLPGIPLNPVEERQGPESYGPQEHARGEKTKPRTRLCPSAVVIVLSDVVPLRHEHCSSLDWDKIGVKVQLGYYRTELTENQTPS